MNQSVLLALLSSALLSLSIWRFGLIRQGYSHVTHTISELGEVGSPGSKLVSLGIFLPFGLSMLAVYWLSRAGNPSAANLAGCIGVGYLGAALFPCDPGSPLVGSWRQSLHNLAGAVQYVGGAAFIWNLGSTQSLFAIPAVAVCLAAVMLSVPAASPWRGVIQRVAEAALLASLLLALGASHVT